MNKVIPKTRVTIEDKQVEKSKANPPKVTLNVEREDQLEVKAPDDSDLWVFFFPGAHVKEDLFDPVPPELKSEYAPFGGDGRIRVKAGTTWTSEAPGEDWPRKEKNAYPYLIYVEKHDRLAHGNSPPEIILL